MTPGASDQDEQGDDLTEEMRLENGSDLARAFFTSAVLVGVPRSGAAEFDSQHSDVPSFGKAEKSMTAAKMYC
jgi:hypothetical protein